LSITSTLEQLNNAFSGLLTSDAVFNGSRSTNGKPVPVVTEQIGDVVSYTQKAIGEMGLVAVVLTPYFKLLNRSVAPLVSLVTISIQVSEFYAINRSKTGIGISAETLVCRILELTHWKSHNVLGPGFDPRLQIIELVGVKLLPQKDIRGILTYLMLYETQLVIKTI
jgi:hypothetical protein